jgi:hypothetical protein
MLTWNRPTSAPRRFAGAISASYTGASTDDPPMAIPARNRHSERSEVPRKRATQCGDHIEHADDSPRVAAAAAIVGAPMMSAPSNVPHNALETAAPRPAGESEKISAQRVRDAGDDGCVEAEQYCR